MFPFEFQGREYFHTIYTSRKPLTEKSSIEYIDNTTQTQLFSTDILPSLIRRYILFSDPSVSIIIHSLARNKQRRNIKINNIQLYHSETQTTITQNPAGSQPLCYISNKHIPISIIYSPTRLIQHITTEDQTYLYIPAI